MDEKTVTMMEGVAREWRVRVMDSAGNVLDPEGFSFYGAAADGVQVPRRMQVHVEGDVAVLRLPGLWMSGRCWRYQVLCQDVLTGVEWVLCQGDVVLERRVACNGPALHEDAVLVDAVLDSELEQVEVFLGDSTAASAEAARQAVAARAGAEAAAERVAADVVQVEDLKRVTLDAAAGAALSAERAEDSKRGAEAAAGDAAADAQVAEGKAAEAEVSREAAEAAAQLAGARAAEADASAKVAGAAVSDALAARDEAAAARDEAVGKAGAAEASRVAAEAAADDARVSRAVANAAQEAAEAAQSTAEAQAAIATAAAEAALTPESIAAQAARPATMVLLKDELLRIVGDPALFVMDTDGQKIIVHTDRLDDALLAAVEDILERFVPQFIDVAKYNHHIEVSWRDINKYAHATKTQDLYDMNPDYKSDLTSDGEWVYPLPEMVNFGRRAGGNSTTAGLANSNVKKLVAHFPKAIKLSELCRSCKQLKILKINAPLATSVDCIIASAYEVEEMELICPESTGKMFLGADCFTWNTPKLKKVKCVMPKVTEIDMHYNNGALTEFDAEFPSLKDSPNFCPLGILNKASVIKILNSLPTWTDGGTHRILIGIHVDHQTDDDVLEAIANAEAKGWALTVQWNGTPTASASVTYGLRKPPIYAKVSEMERPDGTTERVLDWGHYVTDTSGYEEFRSVEAAREYYGLPEEDLTEND